MAGPDGLRAGRLVHRLGRPDPGAVAVPAQDPLPEAPTGCWRSSSRFRSATSSPTGRTTGPIGGCWPCSRSDRVPLGPPSMAAPSLRPQRSGGRVGWSSSSPVASIPTAPTFVLQPVGAEATRLLIRTRGNYAPWLLGLVMPAFGLFDATYGVAQRAIARRAEALATTTPNRSSAPTPPPSLIAGNPPNPIGGLAGRPRVTSASSPRFSPRSLRWRWGLNTDHRGRGLSVAEPAECGVLGPGPPGPSASTRRHQSARPWR